MKNLQSKIKIWHRINYLKQPTTRSFVKLRTTRKRINSLGVKFCIEPGHSALHNEMSTQ